MKRLLLVIITVVFALVGCQGTNNKDSTNTENTRYEQTRYNDMNITKNERFTEMRNREDELNKRIERNDNQGDYRVSQEAADRITKEVDEINNAYVLTTENNAYVAATLKKNNDKNSNDRSNNDQKETNNNNNNNNFSMNQTNDNRMMNDDHNDITDEVKNKVAKIVQSVDKDIDNVYVTTSPDFMNLSEQYSNDLNDGKPVRGFFDQIGNAIERIFPQDKTKGNHSR